MISLVVAEKGLDSTWKEVPIQYHYRSERQQQAFAEIAVKFMNSARPTHNSRKQMPGTPTNFQFVGSWE